MESVWPDVCGGNKKETREGEVLERLSQRSGIANALRVLNKAMKRYGNPLEVVTDRLRSYRAAMKEMGNEARQHTGRWLALLQSSGDR